VQTLGSAAARDGEPDKIISLRAARDVGPFVIFIRVRARIAAATTTECCDDNVNRISAESSRDERDERLHLPLTHFFRVDVPPMKHRCPSMKRRLHFRARTRRIDGSASTRFIKLAGRSRRRKKKQKERKKEGKKERTRRRIEKSLRSKSSSRDSDCVLFVVVVTCADSSYDTDGCRLAI
jgi:hypothetical protein